MPEAVESVKRHLVQLLPGHPAAHPALCQPWSASFSTEEKASRVPETGLMARLKVSATPVEIFSYFPMTFCPACLPWKPKAVTEPWGGTLVKPCLSKVLSVFPSLC